MDKTGVLLVNLGTPDTCAPKDVRKYLIEFLTDGRVIDVPWLTRQFLVRGMIVPKRYKDSAENYARIWTEEGSPLKIYGTKVQKMLENSLGETFQIELAMRYQNPSIASGLEKLAACTEIVILPLFPQYASATTGSVHQEVMDVVRKWPVIPELHFINSYPVHPLMIDAFAARGRELHPENYDHVVFSFHGLPERHVLKSDRHHYCLRSKDCCKTLCDKNALCYSAQCHATAQAIADRFHLPSSGYTVCFQSRLGNDPWLKPYTTDTLSDLLKKGKKRVLVYSPAFVCDCLETIDEIGKEYKEMFLEQGGEALDLVPGLNDHPLWIEALKTLILENKILHL